MSSMTTSEPVLELIEPGERIKYRGKRGAEREVTINRKWRIELDGEVLGFVEYRMATREQRTPGRMYVNSRWRTPAWFYIPGPDAWRRGYETFSKKYAVERIVADYQDKS